MFNFAKQNNVKKRNMKLLRLLCAIATSVLIASCGSNYWEEGWLEIHHIATGRGNCCLIIMPDGTKMMVDAGDLGGSEQFTQEILPALPNDSKRPAEWQAEYVKKAAAATGDNEHIDYLLVTHFDMDHLGIEYDGVPQGNDYYMSGVTHLGNILTIDKIVDRGYPDYDFPYPGVLDSTRSGIQPNLKAFCTDRNVKLEGFEVGSTTQFAQKYNPRSDFRIVNRYASGKLFKDGKVITLGNDPKVFVENNCSCTIDIEYGDFRYHISGDIFGDVERAVGEAEGKITGMLADHHSYTGTMTKEYLAFTQPEIITIPTWDYFHPQPDELHNMFTSSDNVRVFTTGMVRSNLERLGEEGRKMSGHGHIVIRVSPGGKDYKVYAIDPAAEY